MKTVFLDTSFLRSVKWNQDSDWQKLLKMSREDKLRICIPEIVKEEWRTSKRDNALSIIKRTESDFQRLKAEWGKNSILRSLNPIPDYSAPTPEFIDRETTGLVQDIIEKNKIEVIKTNPEHFQEMLSKYFNWQPPFHVVAEADRDDSKKRPKRRENIPDGIIIEVINDAVRHVEDAAYFLHNNGADFKDALDKKVKLFKTAKEVLADFSGKGPTSPVKNENLEDFLAEVNSIETDLSKKIMGYTKWFAPLEKTKLEDLLIKKGFSSQQIEANAQRLVTAGIIKDTGYHYLPENNNLYQEASNAVMSEVLKIIDEDGHG